MGGGVRRSLYVHGRIASDCGKEFMVPHCDKEREKEGEHKTRATELLFPNGGRARERESSELITAQISALGSRSAAAAVRTSFRVKVSLYVLTALTLQ